MYQVTVKGRTLEELKKAVSDINNELTSGVIGKSAEVVKDLEQAPVDTSLKEELIEASEPAMSKPVVATPTPINNDVELDAEGLPWDKRIHASSKAKVKDGTWRTKRGADENEVRTIKDELRTRLAQAANPPSTPAPPINESTPVVETPVVGVDPAVPGTDKTVGHVVQPTVTPQAPVVDPNAADIQSAPAIEMPTQPSTSQGHTEDTFVANFPMVMANLITEGKINQDYVNQLKAYFQVTEIWNITEVQKRQVFDNFVSAGVIQKAG